MTTLNVTIDDFDPLIKYSDYALWSTPDPSTHPSWYNASESVTGVPWHEATIHYTTAVGASFSLNFTSGSIWIYGAAGPSSTNYTVSLDGTSTSATASNVTDGRALLYSNDGLTYGPHEISVVNEGSGLGVDLVVLGVDFGESPVNATIDDASGVTYSGTWTSENGSFYGGTSVYTQGPNNSLSFNFTGSAIYLYGDIVNDHGPYSIYLNDSSTPYATYTGRSGCGVPTDGYEKSCEKLGVLKTFIGNLPLGQHAFTLVNEGPSSGNETYFDFDYVTYTTPTTYPSYTIDASCSYGNCDGGSNGNSSSSSSSSSSAGGSGTSTATSPSTTSASSTSSSSGALAVSQLHGGLLLFALSLWMVRKLF